MEKLPFNHEAEEITEACNVDLDRTNELENKLMEDAEGKFSKLVELYEKEFSFRELAFLAAYGKVYKMPIPKYLLD